MDRGVWWATVHGVTELDTTEQLNNKQQHTVSYNMASFSKCFPQSHYPKCKSWVNVCYPQSVNILQDQGLHLYFIQFYYCSWERVNSQQIVVESIYSGIKSLIYIYFI